MVIRVRKVLWNSYWMELSGSLGVHLRPAMRQFEETLVKHVAEP